MEQEMSDMKNTEKKLLKQDDSNSSDVAANLAIEPKLKPALPPITASKTAANNGPNISNYSTFSVIVTGQLESCEMPGENNLYCKYRFVWGEDWAVAAGLESGLTQYATPPIFSKDRTLSWNFPIEISFRSTNVYGWPKMCVSVFGPDLLGRDVIKGYGFMHVPLFPGKYTKNIPLFSPTSTSIMNELSTLVKGEKTEFKDSKFVTQSEGRQGSVNNNVIYNSVISVKSQGSVLIKLNVITKGMESFGYSLSQ